jgi:hypothetical protein
LTPFSTPASAPATLPMLSPGGALCPMELCCFLLVQDRGVHRNDCILIYTQVHTASVLSCHGIV